MKRFNNLILLALIVFSFVGCTASRSVSRIATDEVSDLSGRWNDTDSRLVAEQMTEGLTSGAWLDSFLQENQEKPVLVVGTIRNLTSEHIPTEIFIKDIERELINNGSVTFVANDTEREEVREERLDQQLSATEETAKRLAAETGADFMLKGAISSLVDEVDGKAAKFYQVDFELINLENNQKVWIDTKKIKKLVKRAKAKW